MLHISAFPSSLLSFCISIFHTLLPKVFPGSIVSSYMVLPTTHLSRAWNLLIHHFSSAAYTLDHMPGNDDEQPSISQYKVKLGCEEGEECAVCLCKIEAGEEIRELRCDHLFHRVCLDRWLQYKRATCPLCRGSLAPRRAVGELGEETLVFRFCSLSSSDRCNWWLR